MANYVFKRQRSRQQSVLDLQSFCIEEWQGERWRRTMALLDNSTPPLVIMYYRVDEGK